VYRSIVLLATVLFVGISTNAGAQLRHYVPAKAPPKDTSTFLIFKDITIGPYVTAGVSRQNENIPEGWHSNPGFAYSIGVMGDFTIKDWFGFTLALLYDTRDLYLATTPGDNTSIDMSIGYIAVQPSIRLFWLLVGLAFDFPTASNATETISPFSHLGVTTPYMENLDVSPGDLNTLTELHATLSIPIYQVESADLHLILSGSYPLSKTIRSTTSFDTTGYFSKTGQVVGQGPLPTLEAGITYQFDLLH
jgi:hypothetical protein